MAVPEGEQEEGRFKVTTKANKLAVYTIRICCNTNVFPEQYQNALTNDIIRTAKNIFMNCWTANNIRIRKTDENRNEKVKARRELQERAAIECNNLLALMQMAQTLFHLKTKRIKFWGEETIKVRNLIRSWIESDTKRYSHL